MSSLPIVGWRLWYGDYQTFSHTDGSWDQAPSSNVQVLQYLHEPPYNTLTYGEDEYRLTPDASVKLGAWMGEQEFDALIKVVLNSA